MIYLCIFSFNLFFIVLLFLCAYNAWVISPPCPHPLPYHPLHPLPLPISFNLYNNVVGTYFIHKEMRHRELATLFKITHLVNDPWEIQTQAYLIPKLCVILPLYSSKALKIELTHL
jgi:hypothetical protein